MKAWLPARAVFLLIGFTAAIAQIVLLRELMVVFYGNEISIGLMLASWLFWTAAGSALAGRMATRVRQPRTLVAAAQVLIALVLPSTVMGVRAARTTLETVPGEILGPGSMLVASLAAVSLFGMLSGALFTASSRLCQAEAAEATAAVYLWEAAGSSLGGVLAGLVLVRYAGSLEIAFLLALVNLLAASGTGDLSVRGGSHWLRRAAVPTALLGASAGLVLTGAIPRLEFASQARMWRGTKLIATRNSVYGNLAVAGTSFERSIYENGMPLFHAPDPEQAEDAVDYALLEHPAPHTLLLIGGGYNGSIAEALRHPGLERVDYVELDPAVLDLARQYFPGQWRQVGSDPRVHVHVTDGRLFLKTTAAAFDVIVVNLPDPLTAQLNRFYTLEFFREVSARLSPGGVFSFRLASSENYISPELAGFLRSIYKTLGAVFPRVALMPGETVHFFAARREGVLASGAEELLARLRARNLKTSYVREYYIPFRMAPDRMTALNRRLEPAPATPLNRDFAPIAYYFDVALWSGQFHHGYRRFFGVLAGVDFGALAATLALLLAILTVAANLRATPQRRMELTAAASAGAMGFTMIALELLLLLAFQALYGYVYRQLALLIAAFMAGMALGSALALCGIRARLGARREMRAVRGPGGSPHHEMRALALLQAAAAVAPPLLCGLFSILARADGAAASPLFPALALGCGMLGGYQFPLASRIFFSSGRHRGAGTLYALDLAGSCLGAMLISAWLIPVFGFFRTALLAAIVNLAPAAMAILPVGPAASALRKPGP